MTCVALTDLEGSREEKLSDGVDACQTRRRADFVSGRVAVRDTTIERLDSLFSKVPLLVADPVPDVEIDRAERLLGAKFVPAYRSFLGRYGGAMVGSLPVLGLRRAEVMGDDLYSVVDVTKRFRHDGWQSTERWLVISVDGFGNPIGIAEDGQVWISDHDAGQVAVVAPSFEDFVLRLLDEAGG